MRPVLLACLIVVAASAYAQRPAPDTFVKVTSKTKDGYNVSSQSHFEAVKPGEIYEMSFIAQEGMDYRLSAQPFNPSAGTVTCEVYELIFPIK